MTLIFCQTIFCVAVIFCRTSEAKFSLIKVFLKTQFHALRLKKKTLLGRALNQCGNSTKAPNYVTRGLSFSGQFNFHISIENRTLFGKFKS